MPKLFIEVYRLTEEGEAEVPVDSAVCLFIFTYLQHPPPVSLTFIVTNDTTAVPYLRLSVEALTHNVLDPADLQPPISDCYLPVFTADDSTCCVAGLCAVLRQVVKHSGAEWHHLLGFREGCLFACAEISLWTKFCEIDVVEIVHELLSNEKLTNKIEISKHLARFEEHLKQPVRMHNVDKLRKKINKDQVVHDFAEGHAMSLADLIIVPCIHVFIEHFTSKNLRNCLPRLIDWYNLVVAQKYVKDALNVIKDVPISCDEFIVDFILPEVPDYSLYKSDPKRYKPRWKQFTRQEDVDAALQVVEKLQLDLNYDSLPFGNEMALDWQAIPEDVQPDVPSSRLLRKREQLENLAKAIIKVARPGDTIVDFCCGSGHLGILVAYCLPQCRVVLLDNKEQSLDRAKNRVSQLGLSNVFAIQCNLDYFKGSFQIGVSLHACGVASDLVIHTCLQQNAAFVVCPCCYGSLQDNHMVSYPQSVELSGLSFQHYLVLGHSADQTHTEHYAKSEQGERCMAVVDSDRCLLAKSRGYSVSLAKLVPPTCSPKNNLLVGIPQSLAA